MWSGIESVVDWSPWLSGIVTAYFPTLLLLIINTVMAPFVFCEQSVPAFLKAPHAIYLPHVFLTCMLILSSLAVLVRRECPLTKTGELRSMLVRYSVYLVLGTVILPSLALTTIDAFILHSSIENLSLRELFQSVC